jgi:hypothetical protein
MSEPGQDTRGISGGRTTDRRGAPSKQGCIDSPWSMVHTFCMQHQIIWYAPVAAKDDSDAPCLL